MFITTICFLDFISSPGQLCFYVLHRNNNSFLPTNNVNLSLDDWLRHQDFHWFISKWHYLVISFNLKMIEYEFEANQSEFWCYFKPIKYRVDQYFETNLCWFWYLLAVFFFLFNNFTCLCNSFVDVWVSTWREKLLSALGVVPIWENFFHVDMLCKLET